MTQRFEYPGRDGIATCVFFGVAGNTYAFYSVARDSAGNVEDPHSTPDATTMVGGVAAVPKSPGPRFYLAGALPNPSRHGLRVWFSLPSPEPAWLEAVDVTGRRVIRVSVGALGPGDHAVDLADRTRLAPGVYWIRLTQASRSMTARAVVIH